MDIKICKKLMQNTGTGKVLIKEGEGGITVAQCKIYNSKLVRIPTSFITQERQADVNVREKVQIFKNFFKILKIIVET